MWTEENNNKNKGNEEEISVYWIYTPGISCKSNFQYWINIQDKLLKEVLDIVDTCINVCE